MSGPNKKGMSLEKKHNVTGWVFLIPATALICWMSFYPMIKAFIMSMQTGIGINLTFGCAANYLRYSERPYIQTVFVQHILLPDHSGTRSCWYWRWHWLLC